MATTIPKHWATKTLGEVCEINIGKTPSRSNKKYWDIKKNTNNIWLSIADFSKYISNKNILDSKEYITNEGAYLFNSVKQGTLLLSFKLTIGKVAFAGTELHTNEAIAALPIKNNKELNKEYLYYYLMHYNWDLLTRNDIKVKGKTLNKQKLNDNVYISIPPLEEQKEIVAILDKAFEKLDHALTSCQQALALSKELWLSSLDKALAPRDSWATKTLGEVCEFYRGLTYKKSDEVELSTNIILRSNNVDLAKHKLNFDELKYISDNIQIPDNKKVKSNSLLICTANGSKSHLGKVAIIDKDYGYAFGGFMGLLIPNTALHFKFLFYTMISKNYKSFINKLSNGANIHNLKWSELELFSIPLPPLEEQKEIVAQLDKIQDYINKLEYNYAHKILYIKELKASLLNDAFTGKLTNKE